MSGEADVTVPTSPLSTIDLSLRSLFVLAVKDPAGQLKESFEQVLEDLMRTHFRNDEIIAIITAFSKQLKTWSKDNLMYVRFSPVGLARRYH